MDILNLPKYDINISEKDGKTCIYDQIRRKYVVLTPEEWVRQHMVNYMVSHLGYPRGLLRVESGLRYNNLQKRTDIVAYDKTGHPLVLVECKASHIALSNDAIDQAAMYNRVLEARYLVVTNGMEFLCARTSPLEVLPDIPEFEDAS